MRGSLNRALREQNPPPGSSNSLRRKISSIASPSATNRRSLPGNLRGTNSARSPSEVAGQSFEVDGRSDIPLTSPVHPGTTRAAPASIRTRTGRMVNELEPAGEPRPLLSSRIQPGRNSCIGASEQLLSMANRLNSNHRWRANPLILNKLELFSVGTLKLYEHLCCTRLNRQFFPLKAIGMGFPSGSGTTQCTDGTIQAKVLTRDQGRRPKGAKRTISTINVGNNAAFQAPRWTASANRRVNGAW